MTRGDGGRLLFDDADDYGFMLGLLARAKERFGFRLYAYCLMPNHLHLLIQVAAASASVIMHWLQSVYARSYNRRRERWGHVFQDRFHARRCRDDRYMLALLRYIHCNPVRAGLAASASQWPWSGHAGLAGLRRDPLLDPGFPLSLFSKDMRDAARLYHEFVQGSASAGLDAAPESAYLQGPEDCEAWSPPPTSDNPAPAVEEDWRMVAVQIAASSRLSVDEILGPGRTRTISHCRRLLIRRLVCGGRRPAHVASLLGCSPSLVTKACRTP
ncbi:MAG: transposase [Elusimicrobia bacterium]|nr:transposase [Elusimicrobiota bacterium]